MTSKFDFRNAFTQKLPNYSMQLRTVWTYGIQAWIWKLRNYETACKEASHPRFSNGGIVRNGHSGWCGYLVTMHGKSYFFPLLGRCMPKLLKIVFTFKLHPLHANISTPTGTPVPDEKVKELSSINLFLRICPSGSALFDIGRLFFSGDWSWKSAITDGLVLLIKVCNQRRDIWKIAHILKLK